MRRDEVIRELEEAVASNNSVANEYRRNADRAGAAGSQADYVRYALWAEMETAYRYSAGFGAAILNHLRGVSPE